MKTRMKSPGDSGQDSVKMALPRRLLQKPTGHNLSQVDKMLVHSLDQVGKRSQVLLDKTVHSLDQVGKRSQALVDKVVHSQAQAVRM